MRLLLPLYVHPSVDPESWVAASSLGRSLTVVVNVHNGPGKDLDPVYQAVLEELQANGVQQLGYVDLGYGLRPILEILDDIGRWKRYPGLGGVFFDCAPTGAERAGTVALAGRAARRQGLRTVLLNPGTKPDPLYRDLADGVCVFEGHWRDYQGRMAAGYWRNACHLVYGVPFEDSAAALGRLSENGARWGMLTELSNPSPWAGMPRWVDWLAGAGICELR